MTSTLDSKMLHMENYNIQNHNDLLSAAFQLQVIITFIQSKS